MNSILWTHYDFLLRFSVFEVRALCFLSYSCTVLSISGTEFDYFAALSRSQTKSQGRAKKAQCRINITVITFMF